MSTSFLAPERVAGSQHVELGDITVFVVDGVVRTWRDNLPNHRDAALRRCAVRRFKRRDAQATYARLLNDLVHELRRNPQALVPVQYEGDIREIFDAIDADMARKAEVERRALAVVAGESERARV